MHRLIKSAIEDLRESFAEIDEVALSNQKKVLDAFIGNRIALRHFAPTTGYGYDDVGRDTFNKMFVDVICTEQAIVSLLIASGPHAHTIAVIGL